MDKSNKRIPNKPFRLAASEVTYDNRLSRRVPAWCDSGNVRLTVRPFEWPCASGRPNHSAVLSPWIGGGYLERWSQDSWQGD
ncbi:MAG TPA: hypothetical protein VNB49_05385, partial [Candidatus Dormibacteraeota bacterium]|nr:hypothetical protein [Candidatus Dormibacteraeota bacterium]